MSTVYNPRVDIRMLTVGHRLEERVRSNLQLIQDCPLIRQELKDRTRGFVYDIKTGQLTEHGQTT